MKKIFVFIFLILAYGCDKEDALNAPLGKSKRVYDVNSSDPITKFVSQYFADYDKEFIVNPDSSDYLYNFNVKNQLELEQITQTREHILNSIHLVEELFLNSYSKEFIRKNMPYNILLVSKISSNMTLQIEFPDAISSRNFIAINVGNEGKVFTKEEKLKLSVAAHAELITKFMFSNRPFELSKFFSTGVGMYGKKYSKTLTQEELYEIGFIKGVQYYDWMSTELADQIVHYRQWVQFILSTPESKLQEILATYPKMKSTFDVMMKMMKEEIQIDLTKLS